MILYTYYLLFIDLQCESEHVYKEAPIEKELPPSEEQLKGGQ